MGSLSNLYISQSYQSLIHFSTDTSASATLTQLEDGVGNDLGVYFNTEGDVKATGDLRINGLATIDYGLTVSGAVLIDTHYSASTPAYTNQNTNVGNTIIVSGSYPSTNNLPTINDVEIGWLVNGAFVTGAVVTSITGKNTGNVTVVIDQTSARPSENYTFTGSFASILSITGSTEQVGNFDLTGSATISNDLFVGGHLIIEDGVEITGSIDITGDVTASNAWIQGDLVVSGTINAYEIITTIESSSVIFSSGSNILGDSTSDTQTLNGTIIMSGSSQLTGSMTVSNNISSSTVSGIGNVTIYSASVDQRLSSIQTATASLQNFTASTYINFSTSVDSRLDYLEGPFSSSVNNQLITLQLFTASVGLVTTQSFQNYTASTNQRLNSIEIATSSLQAWSSSAKIELTNIELTTASLNTSVSNLNSYTASNTTNFNTLSSSVATRFTYTPTTGSNSFVGDQNITGSLTISSSVANDFNVIGNSLFSGSVRGVIIPITVASSTASMDCSLGNFFTLALPTATITRLVATNIQPGETITLKVTQPSVTGSITYPSNIKFGNALAYSASAVSGATDIVTFVSYDTTTLYAASTKNLV